MSTSKKETLSALFDGETTDFETRQLLNNLDESDKEAWQRYQLIRMAATKSLSKRDLSFDVTQAVSEAIATETPDNVTDDKNQSLWKKPPTNLHWLKPAAGFAAAASVAFFVVIGIEIGDSEFVADGDVSSSQLPLTAEPGLSAVNAKVSDKTETMQSKEQQKQFNDFYIEHFLRGGEKK